MELELSFSSSKSLLALKQNVNLALAKKVLTTTEQKGEQLVEMLKAPHPNLGKSIDLKI